MTQEQINRISASFYRQMFFIRMLNIEHEYFLKMSKHSGIKNVLHRLKHAVTAGIEQLKAYLPNSKDTYTQIMSESEEKISAMCNIIEKISMLDEATVLQLEKDFDEHVKVKY